MRSVQYYINKPNLVNNDIRYMSPEHKAEVIALTPVCTGNIGERLYWLRSKLTAYAACKTCSKPLTSKSFINQVKGYRAYCSRACMRQSVEYDIAYKATCMVKYGAPHSFSSVDVQAKRKATNLARYGDEHPGRWSSELFKDRMSEKYGETNPLRVPDIRNQVSASLKQGYISSGRLDARLAEIKRLEDVELLDEYEGFDSRMRWRHSCGETFSSSLADGKIPSCPKCYGQSRPEYEIFKFVEGLVGASNVISNDRTAIKPLELDVYVPGKQLAIELNGIFYHTELFLGSKADSYHLGKKRLCAAQGIKLLHVFDSEWNSSQEIVKGKLKSALGLSARLHARKLELISLSSANAREFLEENHLQGADKHSKAYGLLDSSGLQAVMTFCKARFSKHEWELSRFASKVDVTVVGGASKLLTAFKRSVNPTSLVTYADARFSDGAVYEALGFKLKHISPPNYWYIKGGQRLSRYQAQKHMLAKLLGSKFDPLLTEVQNMNKNGWYRLFDCGNYVFEL